jgi:hypothetical protein
MTELTTAVCSITPTQRRRYLWAAWWTASPRYVPFQRPDASNGGATSPEEALAEAERISGRHLTLIEPHWASAWNRVLRGEKPTPPAPGRTRVKSPRAREEHAESAWSVLGLSPNAKLAEVKRAYRQQALATHPDQGGDAERFQRVQRAYEKLLARLSPRWRRSP